MKEIFEKRKIDFEKKAQIFKEKGKLASLLRLAFFIVSAVVIILTIRGELLLPATGLILIFFVGFGLLVNYHKKINNQYQFFSKLSEINNNEMRRLQMDIDHLEGGEEYLSESHPYAYDLDIFGKHSLYQLINRAETPKGKDRLAEELKTPFEPDPILDRQEAIDELKDKIDWRQWLQAFALQNKGFERKTFSALVDWLKASPVIKSTSIVKLGLAFYWLLFLVVIYLIISGAISFVWIFAFNIISLVVLGPRLKYMSDVTKVMQKVNELLQAKRNMILHLEKSEFKGPLLKDLQKSFFQGNVKASKQISSLSKTVDYLLNRGNLIYGVVNSFLMLDILILLNAENWKRKNSDYFEEWFEALGGFESINSFAGFAFANPNYAFPDINNSYTIENQEIGHPLIKPGEMVSNDFKMTGKGAVAMITGSNMAGKSTFLRTIGINLVLAQAGAPVCAKYFCFYPCQVYSSMRTKDNLEESISTFYAELLRIKGLLNQISKNKPTFYLLDEILKGTNSKDRHAGASALIRQLSTSNSFGLVSTHDLELHRLEEEIENFENYSFHSEVSGSDIKFDYKLKKGPCKTFNAVALMKKMGIYV